LTDWFQTSVVHVTLLQLGPVYRKL